MIMATMTVTERKARAHDLVFKARGIVSVLGAMAEGGQDPLEEAVPATCWAVRDMLKEAQELLAHEEG